MSLRSSPWRPAVLDRAVLDWPSRGRPRLRCLARTTVTEAALSNTCRPSQESTRSLSSLPTKTSQVCLALGQEHHHWDPVIPGTCNPRNPVIPGSLSSCGPCHPKDPIIPGTLSSWGLCHPRDPVFPGPVSPETLSSQDFVISGTLSP